MNVDRKEQHLWKIAAVVQIHGNCRPTAEIYGFRQFVIVQANYTVGQNKAAPFFIFSVTLFDNFWHIGT